MPEKKRQHYVPQFYLRNFSWDDLKPIHLCHIKTGKQITASNLATQCYEDYFYGKDLVIEETFATLEGHVSPIIKNIIATGCAPTSNTPDAHALLAFILLQYGRTKSHSEENDEQLEKLVKFIAEKEGIPPEELAALGIKYTNPTIPSLKAIAQSLPVAYDLKCKVLRNEIDINFVTSDNPVILYNQYGEDRNARSNIGLACKGLQILYPISPRRIVMLYDGAVYKIGQRRDGFARITQKTDVQQLNDLQWRNALENVYFDNRQNRSEIFRGYGTNVPKRNAERIHLVASPGVDQGDGTSAVMVTTSKVEHKSRLDLAFVRQRQTISDTERDSGQLLLRNPALSGASVAFLGGMDAGKYKASEFGRFLRDREL